MADRCMKHHVLYLEKNNAQQNISTLLTWPRNEKEMGIVWSPLRSHPTWSQMKQVNNIMEQYYNKISVGHECWQICAPELLNYMLIQLYKSAIDFDCGKNIYLVAPYVLKNHLLTTLFDNIKKGRTKYKARYMAVWRGIVDMEPCIRKSSNLYKDIGSNFACSYVFVFGLFMFFSKKSWINW